ncbi:TetR family transcriptional regulator [Micrococcales bacterium 31B]|nr:TetR family transcriptional regulator [Micrococcales bacterium 31B]
MNPKPAPSPLGSAVDAPVGNPAAYSNRPAASAIEAHLSEALTQDTDPDGRNSRWDDHRARRRRHLLKSARRAIHANGSATSMDHIAAAAGTSKSVIYRYFGDRQGLQIAISHAVVDETYWALRRAVDAASEPHTALFAMVQVYLSMVERSPEVYRYVTDAGSADPLVERFTHIAADLLSGPFESFFTPPEGTAVTGATESPPASTTAGSTITADALAWSSGAIGFIRGSGEWWLGTPPERRPPSQELAERITDWLWHGFSPPIDRPARPPSTPARTATPTPSH